MASMITTSVVTGGTNSHATSSAEVNAFATDFIHAGVTGSITLNSGSGGTGSFCVNAQGSPAMAVDVKAGQAWMTATPSGQASQKLRASMTSDYSGYTISSNSSGSTKYDWIYLQVNATNANNPASDASDVTALYTSRSSSNTTDNGTPPTYGILLAVVTVANGASSITNSNISDKRTVATFRSSPATSGVNSLDITTSATGAAPAIKAQSTTDSNVDISLVPLGTGSLSTTTAALAKLGGAWTSYTPSLGNFTLGNGTINKCAYIQTGKTVIYRGFVTLGSTSSLSGQLNIPFPVTAASASAFEVCGWGVVKNGTTYYDCTAVYNSTSTLSLFFRTSKSGTNPVNIVIGSVISNTNITLGSADTFSWEVVYEAA